MIRTEEFTALGFERLGNVYGDNGYRFKVVLVKYIVNHLKH